MRKFSKKQYIAASAAGLLILGGAGVAVAYWTSGGSGTGTATTGSANWQVTIDPDTLADLAPGTSNGTATDSPTDTINFHVKNTSTGVQKLQSATPVVVDTSAGTGPTGCTAADFTVGSAVITLGNVAAGATVDGTFTLHMDDTGVPQNGCQGATVNLKVTVS